MNPELSKALLGATTKSPAFTLTQSIDDNGKFSVYIEAQGEERTGKARVTAATGDDYIHNPETNPKTYTVLMQAYGMRGVCTLGPDSPHWLTLINQARLNVLSMRVAELSQ